MCTMHTFVAQKTINGPRLAYIVYCTTKHEHKLKKKKSRTNRSKSIYRSMSIFHRTTDHETYGNPEHTTTTSKINTILDFYSIWLYLPSSSSSSSSFFPYFSHLYCVCVCVRHKLYQRSTMHWEKMDMTLVVVEWTSIFHFVRVSCKVLRKWKKNKNLSELSAVCRCAILTRLYFFFFSRASEGSAHLLHTLVFGSS